MRGGNGLVDVADDKSFTEDISQVSILCIGCVHGWTGTPGNYSENYRLRTDVAGSAMDQNRKWEAGQNIVELSLYRMAFVNIVILVAANQATILTRFSGVFSLYAIADFSEQVARLQYRKNREIVTILALVLFAVYGVIITIYRTPEWQTTYPFKWWL